MGRSQSLRDARVALLSAPTVVAGFAVQIAAGNGADFVRWKLAKVIALSLATTLEPWVRFVVACLTITLLAVAIRRLRISWPGWVVCGAAGGVIAFACGFFLAAHPELWVVGTFARAPYEWLWKVGSLDMLTVFIGSLPVSAVAMSRASGGGVVLPNQGSAPLIVRGLKLLTVYLLVHVAVWILEAIVRSPAFAEALRNVSLVVDAIVTCWAGVAMLGAVLWSDAGDRRRIAAAGLTGACIAAAAFSRLLHHLVFAGP